ncbi:hypothetical protein SHAb15599_00136 [Acinetobacter phage SH-Ab 15599]|nr:hypothetical protein SHAb15599_00136 [Acinetobacter phage SH-Ab 15599]
MNDKQLLKLMASNIAAGMVSSLKDQKDYDRFKEMADREGLKVRTWITKNSVRQAKSISKEVDQTYTVVDEQKD